MLVYKEYETWGRGYFLRIASGIEVPNFVSVFLEFNNENDNFFYTWVNLKKNELHHNENFSISYK